MAAQTISMIIYIAIVTMTIINAQKIDDKEGANMKPWKKELIERLKEKNPYPQSIFSEPTDEEWYKVNSVLIKHLGFPLDRVSGSVSRDVWNAYEAKVIKAIQQTELVLDEEKLRNIMGKFQLSDKKYIAAKLATTKGLIKVKE